MSVWGGCRWTTYCPVREVPNEGRLGRGALPTEELQGALGHLVAI